MTVSHFTPKSHNISIVDFCHVLQKIEKTHPADWRNPGRVKVLIKKDNQYAHPVIQNRKLAGE